MQKKSQPFSVITGGREYGDHKTPRPASAVLKETFDKHALYHLKSASQSRVVDYLIDAFQQALERDAIAMGAYFNPNSGQLECVIFDNDAAVKDAIFFETTRNKHDSQLRFIFDTSVPFQKVFSPEELSTIENTNDLLKRFRDFSFCNDGYDRYTEQDDIIITNSVGPHSEDINKLKNLVNEIKKSSYAEKYVWFYQKENGGLAYILSSQKHSFLDVNTWLNEQPTRNVLYASLDLRKPFEQQFSAKELATATFDSLLSSSPDNVNLGRNILPPTPTASRLIVIEGMITLDQS